MEELALHILDIVQNSVSAGADNIEITINCDEMFITIIISDNGCGMSEETVRSIIDPFSTSRTSRKVGLGIPLLKQSCEQAGGSLTIHSGLGEGTKVTAVLEKNNLDRPPLGNMGGTISALICCNPSLNFEFIFTRSGEEYTLTTEELKQALGDVPLSNPEIAAFIEKDVNSGIQSLCMEDII